MFASALTLALLGIAMAAVIRQLSRDGDKIIAALRGESWIAAPPSPQHPVIVRLSQRYPATRPMRARPEWRAAA